MNINNYENKSNDISIIDLTPENISDYGVCGYKDVEKHIELRRKIDWLKEYYPKGLRIKALISETGGYQGMIEYVPGEFAHRPIEAADYLFIHCIFVGFKKEFKGRGYASAMIKECIKEANKSNMNGVAVVTRKGSFMADKQIFIKNGFTVTDQGKPDFELLAYKFDKNTDDPKFRGMSADKYANGLYIIRSPQCPYSVKNVDSITKTAQRLNIKAELVDLRDHTEAQQTPCAFGTFCIIYNGEIISHHPISNTRFENIMRSKENNNK